jgi:hypothetical protein
MGRVIIVLLACLIILSATPIILSDTQTQINVTNSGPELIQNIPDFFIPMNAPTLNLFDLDDYIEDPNGDPLTFTHTTINNVTITIDSENRVSFYPDIGYMGTQSLQFTASDGSLNGTTNAFDLTVGIDTQPPQWSNPRKNKPSVYQNYYVTFLVDWTDNVGLEEFIFSINQGLGWQNQTAVPFTGTSNVSTFRIQISAAAGTTISWTFYAKDIYDNKNRADTQTFVVKEITFEPGDEYEGEDTTGDATAEDDGVSYGSETTKLDYFKEGVLGKNLEVDTRSIKVSIKQGSTITKVVKIINTGDVPETITASLKNINQLAMLGDTLITIAPGETVELLVEFIIPMSTVPDQYFGFLLLDYGDQISIPVVIDVKKFESEVEITVNLTKDSKIVRAGNEVTALITIKNLKDIETSPSQFYYALKNFKGSILESKNEDITLSSLFEEERTLTLPDWAPDGEYIFYARIISGDSMDLDSETFLAGARFKIIAFMKKLLYPIIILILLTILLLLYLIYKRNKKKKRLLELYLLLNELRGLVKEGKTMEAMDIYKRIKLTYSQHVEKGFMENEAKLREELSKFSKILIETESKPVPTPQPAPTPQTPKPELKPTTQTPSTNLPQKPEITSTPLNKETQKNPEIPKPKTEEPKPTTPKTTPISQISKPQPKTESPKSLPKNPTLTKIPETKLTSPTTPTKTKIPETKPTPTPKTEEPKPLPKKPMKTKLKTKPAPLAPTTK